MRGGARKLVVSGIERALTLRGLEGEALASARRDAVAWARTRGRALSSRSGVIGGVGVEVTRPGRAELRPIEVALAGPGEVTVEVLVSAISPGTERAQWLRLPNAQPALPYRPGYSGAGRVLAVHGDAHGLAEGDLVAVPRAPHASVVTVPSAWVTPVPDGVTAADAALVYLAIIAGYGVRRAGTVTGRSVCVIGAGPIGALAHRLLALDAPGPVTVVAASRRAERAALDAGAARFLTATEDVETIAADVVIEVTGDPAAVAGAVRAAAPGATVVLLGSPRGTTRDVPIGEIRRKRLKIAGAHVSALATEMRRDGGDPFADISRRFLDAVARGALSVADLAGEASDPREIGLTYRRLAASQVHSVHLDWSVMPRAQRVSRRRLVSPPPTAAEPPPVAGTDPVSPRAGHAPLRFVAIGCGDIGFANARAIAGAAGAELVLCHDPVPGLADTVAEQFGAQVAPTLTAALDASRVDAVFLSVPNDLHAPLIDQATAVGLHVIVEKPLAVDLRSARAAVESARAAGVSLSVCFPFRYERAIQSARRLVRAGALGPLRGANVVFHMDKPASYWLGGFSGRAVSEWRASGAGAGGGVLIMNLTHYVDFLRHVAGAEPVWVSGTGRADDGAEVESAVALSVGFAGGAVGTVTGSASTPGAPANRVEIWGELGTLRLEPEPAIFTERVLEGVTTGRWTSIAEDPDEDVRLIFVERFAAGVQAGEPPEIGPADGLAVQAFVDAAYRAIASGERVELPAMAENPR